MNEPDCTSARKFLRGVQAYRIALETPPPVVELSETERAHLALDLAGAPRELAGLTLDLAQRVEMLHGMAILASCEALP